MCVCARACVRARAIQEGRQVARNVAGCCCFEGSVQIYVRCIYETWELSISHRYKRDLGVSW